MAKRSAARHVRQLQRRHDTLVARVDTGRGASESWDKAELAALEWALPILKERSPAHGGQVLRPVDDGDTEPAGACPADPDGLHHVGCGCEA